MSVRFEIVDGVAEIVLDRSAKRNALTVEMLAQVRDYARRAGDAGDGQDARPTPDAGGTPATPRFLGGQDARPTVRALLLRGDGRVFCAGFDLGPCLDEPKVLADLLRMLAEAVGAMRGGALPVVSAAHGAAIAGGCALLGGADVVVADAGAKIGYPVTPLGISPAVSAPTLAALVGGRARELLLHPVLIDGREAHTAGLVHVLTDSPEDVLESARAIARTLADKPRAGMEATRAWLNRLEDRMGGMEEAMAAALGASLADVGGQEQRSMLARVWTRR